MIRGFPLIALVTLAACGGSERSDVLPGQASGGESEDELREGATRVYDCRGEDQDSTLGRFELVLSNRNAKAKVTSISKNAAAPGDGTIDPDYRPVSASYQGGARYTGFEKIRESMSASDFGSLELIISKELKEGGDRKRAWIRYTGGGATTEGFVCHKRAAPFAVEVARKARLQCESELLCTDDNPPGSTCLSEIFVKQTEDDKATLRLTYLDHFGVNVRERQENIGDSTELARTKTKVDAKFGEHEIELKYRAGITYLGKLKMPDGRTAKLDCNDLAMLD